MACNCPEYTCLDVAPAILQCGDDITTNLIADETGIWLMKYEFNGRWFGREITVTNGQLIVIPNMFNEHYVHTIQFFNNASDLFNDTCYRLDTAQLPVIATNSPITPSGSGSAMFMTVEVEADGVTVEIPSGREVWVIFMGNQAWQRDVDFTQSGTTITITNGSTLTAGQTLLMMYL